MNDGYLLFQPRKIKRLCHLRSKTMIKQLKIFTDKLDIPLSIKWSLSESRLYLIPESEFSVTFEIPMNLDGYYLVFISDSYFCPGYLWAGDFGVQLDVCVFFKLRL